MVFVYGYVYPAADASHPIRRAEHDVDQNSGTRYAKRNAFVVWTQDLELRKQDPWLPPDQPGLKDDNVHFGSAGQLELGRLMADTLISKAKWTSSTAAPSRVAPDPGAFTVFPSKGNTIGISYELLSRGQVRIDLLTPAGVRLGSRSIGIQAPGRHREDLAFGGLRTGTYLIRLSADHSLRVQRIAFLE